MPKKSAKSLQGLPFEQAPEHSLRSPPQNLEAEKGVIGAILINPLICDEVATILRPEDFLSVANQKLFRHLMEMHGSGNGIDLTLLLERLEHSGDLVEIGGEAYLGEIMSDVQVAAHAPQYAQIVRDKAVLRDLIVTSTDILSSAYEPTVKPREIVNRAEEKIFALSDKRNSNQIHKILDVVHETFSILDAKAAGGDDGTAKTGFRAFDNLTGGLHPGELIILAARPSMGKTALATNIADYVAVDQKIPTLIVSLEMTRFELAQRILCSRGRIDSNKMRIGILSKAEKDKLTFAADQFSTASLLIDDSPSRTVTEIGAIARRVKRQEGGLGLIVIDYLGLIEPDMPSDPRQEQVAKIARRLKGLAKELEVPVLCLAQVNRQPEATKDNIPRLSHLRESGAIEQDADVVVFVHRPGYYLNKKEAKEEQDTMGEHADNQAELIIAKQRNGPIGEVKLAWLSQYTRFENLDGDDDNDPGGYRNIGPHHEFDSFGDVTPQVGGGAEFS